MALRAENVVAFYYKRGTCEQWIKEGKGAIKWTRLSRRLFRRQCRTPSASRADLQSRQFPAHAGDAGVDQGKIDDSAARDADQDRSEGHRPCPLRLVRDHRGRHTVQSLRGYPGHDRETSASGRRVNGIVRSVVTRVIKNDGKGGSR
jgi:hypothetical protein